MSVDVKLLFLASWGLGTATWLQNASLFVQAETDCKSSAECQKTIPNSTCSNGMCTCETGFFMLNKINATSCEPGDDAVDKKVATPASPVLPTRRVDVNMIIIMAVLAIMFLGICVALHLFSKARFRNHRTIFNSPHPRIMHIKLGKKRGGRRPSHVEGPGSRQLSICSQMSPLRTRRGSQSVSPDYKRKSETECGPREIDVQQDPALPQETKAHVLDVHDQRNGKSPLAVESSPSPKSRP